VVTQEHLSRLLLLLYEGASSPERLEAFLGELAHALNARAAAFHEHSFRDRENLRLASGSLFISVGFSEEALRLYAQHYHSKDIYVQRVQERARLADCGFSQALITDAELRGTEVYNDYMRKFTIGPMTWVKLEERSEYVAGMSFNRADLECKFGQVELELIAALIPHMRQALKLSRTLRDLRASNAMLSRGVEEMDIAICMARQDGSVLRTTQGADRLFSAQEGIWLKNGRLKAAEPQEQRALDALIAGACRTSANGGMSGAVRVESKAAGDITVRSWTAQAGGAVLITRRPPLRPLQVVVSPFCPGTLLNESQATALVQFSDPSANPRPRSAILRALYGLTPTESRLADLLLQGLEVREAADRLKTTLETTRFNLKRVLAKSGTRRQSELMRLMLSLPGQQHYSGGRLEGPAR
jgi:DNA-binding CsgD family transcriptional regulator